MHFLLVLSMRVAWNCWKLLGKETANFIDKCVLIGFAIILFLIHVIFLIWLYFAYGKHWEIAMKEKKFLNERKYVQTVTKWGETAKKILETNQI